MKRLGIISLALALALAGCMTGAGMKPLDITMVLLNQGGPFVTKSFAERLARLVVDEKYESTTFLAGLARVEDRGDEWWVTLDNAAAASNLIPYAHQLAVRIRKSNGEIIGIA